MNEAKGLLLNRNRLRSYLAVPRDLETITRSLRRIFYRGYREIPHPYISGDSFKALCSVELEEENWRDILLATQRNTQKLHLIFASGLPKSKVTFDLVSFLEENLELYFPNVSLLFHNGDHFPQPDQIAAVSNRFKSIYAVNWIGSSPNVIPIPIGLENQGYLRNGVLQDYLRMLPKLTPLSERPIKLLAAFSVHTNKLERERAVYFAKQIDGAFVLNKPVTPRMYRELISESFYVLSPPGNGIDCHRTWEALFLGSIPVVRRECWPFHHAGLNVVALKDWQDLINLPMHHLNSTSNFLSDFGKAQHWLVS